MSCNFLRRSSIFLFVLLAGIGVPSAGASEAREISELNDGYSLLYHVAEDESKVSMLFIVKDAPDEVSEFGTHMSKTADQTVAALERIEDHDPAVRFDHAPLPQMEMDVRASIRADKEHQLLFGTTGTEFVRAFLITQIEASTYALNLSKVLAEQETNPRRVTALQHISAEWLARRDEAFRILRDY